MGWIASEGGRPVATNASASPSGSEARIEIDTDCRVHPYWSAGQVTCGPRFGWTVTCFETEGMPATTTVTRYLPTGMSAGSFTRASVSDHAGDTVDDETYEPIPSPTRSNVDDRMVRHGATTAASSTSLESREAASRDDQILTGIAAAAGSARGRDDRAGDRGHLVPQVEETRAAGGTAPERFRRPRPARVRPPGPRPAERPARSPRISERLRSAATSSSRDRRSPAPLHRRNRRLPRRGPSRWGAPRRHVRVCARRAPRGRARAASMRRWSDRRSSRS